MLRLKKLTKTSFPASAIKVIMTNIKPWWDITEVARAGVVRGSLEQAATYALFDRALKEDLCVFEHSKDGNLLIPPDEFLGSIKSLGGKLISKSLTDAKNTSFDTSDHVFAWEDAMISVSFDDREWTYVKSVSLNETLIQSIRDITKNTITQKTKGKVYVFVSGDGGPELRQIAGKAGIELERGNYNQKVIEDFDHIVKDLQSTEPCAKLIIADGEPGTGKTYLVRGITNAVEGATFVLVPPAMIADLMSPSFIPVLMNHHRDGGPIVFIIEDADSCLVKREGDNMNSISSLLNLGAGIFGDLFDVRVIATTNAKKIQMDPAIVRKGRCCRYLEVGALSKEQAEEVFNRLCQDKDKKFSGDEKTYTLADIYYEAKNEVAEKPEKKYAGFVGQPKTAMARKGSY